MRYGLTTSSAPAVEPVTTAEAQTHLRVDSGIDDSYIDTLVASARMATEEATGRALITQTLVLTLDAFPSRSTFNPRASFYSADPSINIPRGPLQSVTSIQYLDADGTLQTFASSSYRVDTQSLVPRIVPAVGSEWPSSYDTTGAVTITYVAGYGDASTDVPPPLIHAIKLLVGTWYDPVRATVVTGTIASRLPDSFQFLISKYKTGTMPGVGV